MRVAICGYLPLALQLQQGLRNGNIEIKVFIKDFITESKATPNLPLISFFDFRRLVSAGELDGVIVVDTGYITGDFTKSIVQSLKLYDIPKVGITYVNFGFFNPIYWLDSSKFFLPYLESDITDKCNLKCAACYHFHNFSSTEDFYPIGDFRRAVRRVAQKCDVLTFRLMGGEVFLLKNLDEYIRIARQYLPNTNLRILSNGLLIPSLPQKILDVIRENNVAIYISIYPPMVKIFDKIKEILEANKISYGFDEPSLIENFHAILTLNGNNDALKARKICGNEVCRSMYKGKIYKCPLDAFSHKFIQKFGIEGFAASTGVDIYSQAFPALIPLLDGDIEMCHWCSEKCREVLWRTTNTPKLEDWLADPDELKNFS